MNKQKQQEQILTLLKGAGNLGVNSYDLTYTYGIKQAPTRIFELRGQGYNISTYNNPNRSVNYILNPFSSEKHLVTKSHVSEVRAQKPTYIFVGNTAIPVTDEEKARQELSQRSFNFNR